MLRRLSTSRVGLALVAMIGLIEVTACRRHRTPATPASSTSLQEKESHSAPSSKAITDAASAAVSPVASPGTAISSATSTNAVPAGGGQPAANAQFDGSSEQQPAEAVTLDVNQRWWMAGPAHPGRIAWSFQVDGKSLEQQWHEYVADMAVRLDADHDGTTKWQELLADPQVRAGGYGNPKVASDQQAYQLQQRYDVDGDQRADPEEVTRFLLADSGLTSDVTVESDVRMSQLRHLDGTLFQHLDRDGDHVLNDNELAEVTASLLKLDVNGDRAITVDELQPVTSQPSSNPPISTFDEPVVLRVQNRTGTGQIQYWLQQVYGLPQPLIAGNGIVSDAQLASLVEPSPAITIKDPKEVKRWPCDLQLVIAFSNDQPPRIGPHIADLPENPIALLAADEESKQAIRLNVGGMNVSVEVDDLWAQWKRGMDEASLLQRLDKDQDGQLNKNEVTEGGLQDLILLIKTDSDVLPIEQLEAEIDRQTSALRFAVRVEIQPAKDVWIGLDQNGDSLLGEREIQQAYQWLKKRDTNHDGVVLAEEIPSGLVVRIARPAPSFGSERAQRQDAQRIPPRGKESSSLEWFDAMDLNRDGELSEVEFPGASATFQQLDADHDGFVERNEAQSYDMQGDTS